ncbi:MAG: tetratricopeptide repeat protein [Acidobacteriota bacterium]|nr:tetratricopeptide repeat protein [Acidobacteriota bacterium]
MFQIIRREILLLVIITVAAVPMYMLTRKVADLNRKRNANIAAYWYRQGEQQLSEGKSEAAIASLRQAATNDRDNPQFAFALAQALAATNRDDEARLALQRLRESEPENPQINLELARLSARSRDLPQALYYYHHSLYGLWAGEGVDEQRRQVRLELIHLLLDRKERSRALAELLVLSSDTPPTSEAQLQLAQLFMTAGDSSRALQHFTEAARLDVRNVAALSGAGEAAFQLGDYKNAERYLDQAVEQDKSAKRAAQLLEKTRLIESSDPLAAHLSRREQARRLAAALAQSVKRLQQCLDAKYGAVKELLRSQAQTILPGITAEYLREDPELLRAGAEVVFKIEETTSQTCGEPVGLDEALLLIGRKHGASER